MTRPLILRPSAEADMEAAFRWYEERSPGLGAEFLRVVEAGLAVVERSPESFPRQHGRARRVLLRRFPYALFYVVDPGLVEVVACMHQRRHPVRWRSRL